FDARVGNVTQADLRSREILEDGDRPSPLLCDPPDLPDALRVPLRRVVRVVQPRHIQPGVDELADRLRRLRRRSDGTDDLRAPHFWSLTRRAFRLARTPSLQIVHPLRDLLVEALARIPLVPELHGGDRVAGSPEQMTFDGAL